MIGRRQPPTPTEVSEPRSFDDFDLRIGDVMRGERATLGKSLLDVQRELKIKATYIAAIENADVSAFESSGFIAGYVRSYARYLGLDPEWTFETFCAESGFKPLTGMEKVLPANRVKGPVFRRKPSGLTEGERDPIAQPRVSYLPAEQSRFTGLEPRAIGSTIVLAALIGGIGYGGWSVLEEVQRVTVAPVERAPDAVAQVDPLEGVTFGDQPTAPEFSGVSAAPPDALAQLYRPQALETPVMIARDGPIAGINPAETGVLAGRGAPDLSSPVSPSGVYDVSPRVASSGAFGETNGRAAPSVAGAAAGVAPGAQPSTPRVTESTPEVMLVAVRPAWVRVRAADGSVLLERTMSPGDSWVVPQSDAPPTLRTGAAGAVYFSVNGQTYGPAGPSGAVVDQIALGSEALSADFALVDTTEDDAAREAVAYAEAALIEQVQPTEVTTPTADTE